MLKVALICLQLGVPRTLATTAFVTAFADGLTRLGVDTRIIGLVHWERSWGAGSHGQWDDAPLAPFASAAPWVDPPRPRPEDAAEAGRLGILDRLDDTGAAAAESPDWFLELLLERELAAFAGDGDLALMVYPISVPVASTAARIARRRGWRLIVQSCETMSGSWIEPDSKQAYVDLVAHDADGMWVLSDFLADYWAQQGVPAEDILVQANVVRQSSFASTPPPRTRSAVYLGNLEHAEVEYLLDVASIAKARVPSFSLSVFADATDQRRRELEGLIASRGLADAVTLNEPVPPSQVPEVLSGADVLVLPRSSGEFSEAGFPNKLGEYLASGRPVVVTRVGDIPRYLVDGESALLVDPDQPEGFADALVRALSDDALADRIGANGACVARDLLASPVAARRILRFVESLTPRPAAGNVEPLAELSAAQKAKVARDDRARAMLSLRRRASAIYRGL